MAESKGRIGSLHCMNFIFVQVIGSVCVCRKLRTKANIFIINLAIADTCVAFVVQGFSIIGKFDTCFSIEPYLYSLGIK